jgi:hypothetical protein
VSSSISGSDVAAWAHGIKLSFWPTKGLRPAKSAARRLNEDAFAGALTRGSFKTIPASEETTNTQRFEADSLTDDAVSGEPVSHNVRF